MSEMIFREEALQEMERIRNRYPDKRAALIPVLHIAQREAGYLSSDCKEMVARLLDIPPVDVEGVARFYTMFKNRRMGRYLIQVCTTLPCALMGAEQMVDYLSHKLNVKVGGTTADERFSLVTVQCLASCGTGPAMMINGDHFENLTPEKIDNILAELP
ncbi:MAG: NADH-quinone oxidoreductase subunit NuoE [Thermodesulfobacteriota bacterium]